MLKGVKHVVDPNVYNFHRLFNKNAWENLTRYC